MEMEILFRAAAFLGFVSLTAVRVHSQRRILRDRREITFEEGPASLAAGGMAALTSIVFGFEYIFVRGSFAFAYPWTLPLWLRVLGTGFLVLGILLLQRSHAHLAENFHSLVMTKEDQVLVQSGPYRHIRHPIYSAYLVNYAASGLLSANMVLMLLPPVLFAVLVAIRVPLEEKVMLEKFGDEYKAYRSRTGALLPRFKISEM